MALAAPPKETKPSVKALGERLAYTVNLGTQQVRNFAKDNNPAGLEVAILLLIQDLEAGVEELHQIEKGG